MALPKIKVKTVISEGERALVEYYGAGDLHRVSIPADQIEDDEVSQKTLSSGIEYGIDWEDAFPGLPGLNWEMHRRGIWTTDDARADITNLRKAVIASTVKIVQSIFEGGL